MNDKEKMTKEEQEAVKERLEAYREYVKTNKEYKKEKLSKVIMVLSVILIIAVFIKCTCGVLEIDDSKYFKFPENRSRFYAVTINNQKITTHNTVKHTVPIIPYLVNYNSYYYGNSNIENEKVGSDGFVSINDSKYIIEINSYTCYDSHDYRIECKTESQSMKKTNDEKIVGLKIHRITNPNEEVYNGEFISDITKYINQKGQYLVVIIVKYGLVETEVEFTFNKGI